MSRRLPPLLALLVVGGAGVEAFGAEVAQVTLLDAGLRGRQVRVLVAALGEDGEPRTDLRPSDLILRLDGEDLPMEIQRVEVPLSLVVAVDATAPSGEGPSALQGARAILDNLSRGDRMAVVALGPEARVVQALTADLAAVDRALAELASLPPAARKDLGCGLRQAVELLASARKESGSKRSAWALLAVTDGHDDVGGCPADQVLNAARAAGVSLSVVAYDPEDGRGHAMERALARDLAQRSGGLFLAAEGNPTAASEALVVAFKAAQQAAAELPPSVGEVTAGEHRVAVGGRRGGESALPVVVGGTAPPAESARRPARLVLWWTAGIVLAVLVAGGLLLRSVLRSPAARARLTVLDGPQRGTAHLVRKRFVMGTDPGCDLVLPGPYVGRRHAEVRAEDGGFRLVDLQSKNGTFLNGTRVGNVLLQAGDTIGLAEEVHLAVELL